MCVKLNIRLLMALAIILTSHLAMSETSEPQATKPIVLLVGEEQDFTGCKMLGNITGASQESDNDKTYPERLIIARNNLKNQAIDLGANTIHVLRSNTARFEIPGAQKQIIFSGNAYFCK